MAEKSGQNLPRRDDQPLAATAPTEELGQRFMVVDPASVRAENVGLDPDAEGRFKWTTADEEARFDTGPKPTKDDLTGDKDAPFDTGPKPTKDDLTGDKDAPFDTGPKPTKDDLTGDKDAPFDTDAEILGKWSPDVASGAVGDDAAELDDSTAWKVDARADAPDEEIDEFAGRFEVVAVPEPLDDALRLDDQAEGLWATADPLLETFESADAFEAAADDGLDF